MDEKYFYEHLHEFLFKLERDSVIVVQEKVDAMLEAEELLKELFPAARVKLSRSHQGWTRDEEIWVNAKEIQITDSEAFFNAVRKADYIEIYPISDLEVRLTVGFKKVMITKEEYENEEF